jgi:hypothetical protein
MLEFLPEVSTPADVHYHDHTVGSAVSLRGRLHDGGDHARRQVVYAEVPRVLEGPQSVGFAGSGETGDDDDAASACGLRLDGLRRAIAHAPSPRLSCGVKTISGPERNTPFLRLQRKCVYF